MKIFWSWQSDYTPQINRSFIREVLQEAIQQVNAELDLEDADRDDTLRPKLDHDTKDAAGMVDIAQTIFAKIAEAAVFVADITPIAQTEKGKAIPNPNVMIELGWAMKALGEERLIAILNRAQGHKPEDMPFDISRRRIMTYSLGENASTAERKKEKDRLIKQLKDAIKTNLDAHSQQVVEDVRIDGVPVNLNKCSIWATATPTINFKTSDGHSKTVNFPADYMCAYLRIIPFGWKNEKPATASIASLGYQEGPIPYYDHGIEYRGIHNEGYIKLKVVDGNDENTLESKNIVMWFDQTGEYWIVMDAKHPNITRPNNRKIIEYININEVIKYWNDSLEKGIDVLNKFDARMPVRVDAGIVNIAEKGWPTEQKQARHPISSVTETKNKWDEAARISFLTKIYNEIRNNYVLSHQSEDDVRSILAH